MRKGKCITQKDSNGVPLVVWTEYDDGMRYDMSADEYVNLQLQPQLESLPDCSNIGN